MEWLLKFQRTFLGHLLTWSCIGLILLASAQSTKAQTSPGVVVQAVLFYSPSCGHCHLVINDVLYPLVEQYGEQLYIVGIDVSQPGGQTLFLAALQHFNLQSGGVPFLVIGETYLVGSVDIPDKFPGMVEEYLAQGGVGWPEIPGLAEAMIASENAASPTPTLPSAQQATPTPIPSTIPQATTAQGNAPQNEPTQQVPTPSLAAPSVTPTTASGLILTGNTTLSPWERLKLDPVGNGLALIVLVGMVLSVVRGIIFFRHAPRGDALLQSWDWLIPVLCGVGLVVSGYLGYVETARVEAVCGPVGDCNTVQQSEYARLFGILPIGILGIAGYTMLLLAWLVKQVNDQRLAAYGALALLGMNIFGVLFSIYLTFLEPFVIGATCAWCLTSAILMMALFWLSLAPGKAAVSYLLYGEKARNEA